MVCQSFRVACFLGISLTLIASSEVTLYQQKVNTAAKQIACDVCKEVVGEVWLKSEERVKRGDDTDEERIEKYIESLCTVNGLQDENTIDTIKEDGEDTFSFRRKKMEDYEAEGGVVETITNPDGTITSHIKMESTIMAGANVDVPADPTTWIGLAIQQGCREALIKRGGASRMASLAFRHFWSDDYADEADQEEVERFTNSEGALRKHICMDVAKELIVFDVSVLGHEIGSKRALVIDVYCQSAGYGLCLRSYDTHPGFIEPELSVLICRGNC